VRGRTIRILDTAAACHSARTQFGRRVSSISRVGERRGGRRPALCPGDAGSRCARVCQSFLGDHVCAMQNARKSNRSWIGVNRASKTAMQLFERHCFLVLGVLGAFTLLQCGGAETSGSGSPSGSGSTGGASGSASAGTSSSGDGVASGTSTGGSGTVAASGSSSGGTTGTGSGSTVSGSSGSASSGASGTPPHRPQSVACPATATAMPGIARPCTTDADCRGDGGYIWDRYCLNRTCSADQCLTDSDCTAGANGMPSVCGCASDFRGNAIHTNACLASTCRVDSDCASGLCSPDTTARCGSLNGYHCRSAADTCRTDADCPSMKSDAGFTLPYSCGYESTVGHWQCAPVTVCNG